MMLRGYPDEGWMFRLTGRDGARASSDKSAAASLTGVLTRFTRKLEQRGIVPFERLRGSQKTDRIRMLRVIKHC